MPATRRKSISILSTGTEEQSLPKPSVWPIAPVAALLIFLALGLGYILTLSDSGVLKEYRGFSKLQWSPSGTCRTLSNNSAGYPSLPRVVTWFDDRPAAVATCKSEWFVPLGNYLELEYAGFRSPNSSYQLYLGIERSSGGTVERLYPGEGGRLGVWRLAGHHLSDLSSDEKVRVHVVDKDPEAGWLSLRDRISFYSQSEFDVRLARFGTEYSAPLSFALAAVLAALLWLLAPTANSFSRVFGLTLLLSATLHFRPDVYFHNDDFAFLARFTDVGWKALFLNHFDHFMPIFAGILYLEYSFFQADFLPYQIVTFTLHGLNGALVWRFLRGINCSQRASIYLACGLFAASWLQLAALQWLTCQSIVLVMSIRLLCYNLALSVLKEGRQSRLIMLVVAMLCAPLCFAGGISISAEVLALALLFGTATPSKRNAIVAASILVGTMSLGLYFASMHGVELVHERVSITAFDEVLDLAVFTLYGSQFGSLLRGILPFDIVGSVPAVSWMPGYAIPLTLGLLVSIALAVLSCRRFDGSWRYWVFGQILLLVPIFLAGIGRLHWGGVEYALAVRYHAIAVLGVCIVVAPFFRTKRLGGIFASLLLCFWLQYQSVAVRSEREYIQRGVLDKRYAVQLQDWVSQLERRSINSHLATGSQLAGLYPIPYGGLDFAPHAYRLTDEPYRDFNLLLSGRAQRYRTADRIVAYSTLVP